MITFQHRQDMRDFLVQKVASGGPRDIEQAVVTDGRGEASAGALAALVDSWLDDLPWDERTVTLTPKMAGFVGEAGDAVLRAREEGRREGRREALEGLIEFMRHGLENP